MRSCPVEVPHILIQNALELLLLKDQQMVEAFLPHAPQKAFADGVGSWGMNRRFEDLDATCPRHPSKAGPKFAVVITNQIFRCLSIWGRFSQLLRHPGIGRGSRDSDMDDSSCLEFDEEEGEERSKEEIGDLQEVARPDLSCVSAQKRAPLLTPWLRCANVPHIFLDCALAHPNAQFQEFPANALSTPQPIVLRHLPDQGNRFRGDLRLVSRSLGPALPIQAKELPMPPEQGVWLNDKERLFPCPNHSCQEDEEHSIRFRACGPFHLAPEDDKLLA